MCIRDRGNYDGFTLRATSKALVFWIDLSGSLKGDEQIFRLTGPDGDVLVDSNTPLKANNISWFAFAGAKKPQAGWPAGNYRAEYRLRRQGRALAHTQKTIALEQSGIGAKTGDGPGD